MKKGLFILLCFISLSLYPQRWRIGFVYSPYCVNKLTFDKDYIIFNNFTSLTSNENKWHGYFTLFSSGIFSEYRWRNFFVHGEINLFENKFKKQLPDWKSVNDVYFNYSDFEIPLMGGVVINPGNMVKVKIFAGINNKIAHIKAVYYSTLTYTGFFDAVNSGFYPDVEQKKELLHKFSSYFIDVIGGIGFNYYGTTIDLRIEKNISDLNKSKSNYNANYKQLMMIRLCFTFNFYKF